jgi:S-adenosylmethionine-diacylglycerol 3-amino-3-carboxypropyl transferase
VVSSASLSSACFNWIHRHNLVYNTCWEDPRLDREALQLGSNDTVLMITSAGCNALDYALVAPRRIYAVDVNPRQNALLELKLAGIRKLEYEDFFDLFGRGRTDRWDTIYRTVLRPELTASATAIWDRWGRLFEGQGRRNSFYFRGSSGFFAWLMNGYINRLARIREAVNELLAVGTVAEQQVIYDGCNLSQALWRPLVQWCLRRDLTFAMLGVPRGQRQQLDEGYPGGALQFIVDRVETVFRTLPLHDNYFWRVYLTGEYTPNCCPEYLKPDNFQRLKHGQADCIRVSTNTLLGFLTGHRGSISRYVLLDHMDWLQGHAREVLPAEWQAMVDRASEDCRFIWRSAGLNVDFVDPLPICTNGHTHRVGERLRYHTEMANHLHKHDRVNTYGSFYIADLVAA